MTCYRGFGNLLDGQHPIWLGDFTGRAPETVGQLGLR